MLIILRYLWFITAASVLISKRIWKDLA